MHSLYEALLQSWSRDPSKWIASTAISVTAYVAVMLAIPVLLARLPADHFARPPRHHRPLVRFVRTIIGALVTAAGVAMLFLPGPGILTIVLGLSIIGGELSARCLRRIVGRRRVLAAINKIRRRRGREPLVPPWRPHDSA